MEKLLDSLLACSLLYIVLLPFFLKGLRKQSRERGFAPSYLKCAAKLGLVFLPYLIIGYALSFEFIETFFLVIVSIAVFSGFPLDFVSPVMDKVLAGNEKRSKAR